MNSSIFTYAGYAVIVLFLLYLFFQKQINALWIKAKVQASGEEPFTPESEEEAEAMENIKNKLMLDGILGIDETLDIYAAQRVELLQEQAVYSENNAVTPIKLQNQLKVNKTVIAWVQLLRIILGTRIGKKLSYWITGGLINLRITDGDQRNNRKKSHKRGNGKVVKSR